MQAQRKTKAKPEQYRPYNRILEASEGKGALFLGDVHSIEQRRLFTESSVKTVVCCIKDYSMKSFQSKFPNIQVACIPLKDKPEQDIVQYFEPAYHAIDKGRVRGNVLVFCFAGVSRSASIVLSYIMRENKLSYEESLIFLKTKRTVCPNKGFELQLIAYQSQEKEPPTTKVAN